MFLTNEQQAILDGAKGETMAKVMKTLVMYGDAFGADKMVPVTSDYNHLVTSFGLKMMKPVFDLMQQLIDAGAISSQKFSVDPRPVDKNVPANFLQNFIFNNIMYATQDSYEEQLKQLGLMNDNAFTCACYLDQVGNKPKKGDVLSCGVCQLRAGRALQPQLRHYGHYGLYRRFRSQLWSSHRRGP